MKIVHWLAALLSIVLISAPVVQSAPALGAAAAGPNIALLAYRVESRDSDADLRRFAQRYVLLFHVKPDQVQTVKNERSSVIVLAYDLPGGEGDWEDDWAAIKSHSTWFAVDTKGLRLKSSSEYWMLRIGNAQYRSYEVNYLIDKLLSEPFDGIYLDVSMPWWAEREPFVDSRGQPTEPAASIVNAWPDDMLTFHREFRAARGAFWHIMNTWPANPGRYDEWGTDLELYLTEVTGVSMDGFGYNRDAPWPEASWKFQINEMRRITGKGKVYLGKCPAVASTDAARRRLQTFCFASYLLGADGKKAYLFPFMSIGDERYDPTLYNAPLGTPSGTYTKDTGKSIYRRAFTTGLVLVNPSGSNYSGVSLGGTYKTLTGQRVTSVTLEPYSAEVLLK